MAIKVAGTTVIDDSRVLQNITGTTGVYSDWHPGVDTITTVIDFDKPMMKLAMTGNVTFTESNKAVGKSCVLVLDTSTTPYAPTFSANIKFSSTPTWSSSRFWIITFVAWDATTVRATAQPFSAAATGGASLQSSFSPPAGWDTSEIFSSNISFPECYAGVNFFHEPGNSRIRANFYDGNSSAPQQNNYVDITYSGLTNITSIQAQYNVDSQTCFGDCNPSNYGIGPLPSSDGYNSGTYYNLPVNFPWMAQANPNMGASNQAVTQADFTSANPDFRIKLVCDQGTFYSTCEHTFGGGTIYLQANYGSQPAV
jgi:hypothetical protein